MFCYRVNQLTSRQKLMLSITDEISMVSFKQYQQMNETMSIVKGTCDGNWGDIWVLAVGDLYQLTPVGQSPMYMLPNTANTLDDFAPNGWEDMKLHELTEIMRQKDVFILDIFSKTEQYSLLLDKLLPDSVMASSRSEENVVLNNFQHKGVSVLVYPGDFIWAY